MAAPTTTSVAGPELEGSTATLNEPSMEDILASIRRIIAEDQSHGLTRSGLTGLTRRGQPAEAAADAKVPAIEAPPTDFMPVTEEADLHNVSHADPLRTSYEAEAVGLDLTPENDAAFAPLEHDAYVDETAPEPVAVASLPEQAPPSFEPPAAPEAEPLISASTGASITSSFQALAESVVLRDPGLVERVMRESMRPLLKEWLDDHLPSIVERLVRSEIERVARGGRSRD
jgi:uncharacterized protein